MKHTPLILLALVAGCGSSPVPDFYTLSPEPGGTSGGVAVQIELRRPGLPGYLDRPNIVRRADAGRLDISGTERWGTSLGELVGATMADNLTQRLPRSTIYTESGTISSDPDIIVEVDLQRFEATPDGQVRLNAQVALHWSDRMQAAHVKRYELTKKPESDDTGDTVAAMSDLLAELSEAISRSIADMASSGAPPQTAGDEGETTEPAPEIGAQADAPSS